MRERVKISGISPRDEMVKDAQMLLKEEIEHDASCSPTMFFYDSANAKDGNIANLRVYGRKNSSLNGNYMNFITTYDNPVNAGDYIHDTKDDTYWLVYNSFNVDDIHYEGKMIQCNYLLRWQLSNGTIVERWTNITSASKYDVGENGNSTITLSSNTFTILMGHCDEGFELEGKRVFIDKKPLPDKVFKITRGDDVLYNYGNNGSLLSFIADKTELNRERDSQELRICDYIDNHSPTLPPSGNETAVLTANISGNRELKVGFARKYSSALFDKNGQSVEWDENLYGWNVVSDFSVEQTVTGNKISLKTNDEDLIGKKFKLQIVKLDDMTVIGEIETAVVDLF